MPIRKIKKVYYIDISHNGRRYRKRIGKDKKIAELKLKEIELKIAKDEHLGISEPKKILFESFAIQYLEYSKVNKESTTYRGDYSNMRANLLPFFSGKFLHKIDAGMIEDFKTKKAAKGEFVAANRSLALLKHMFTIAIERGYANTNPVKKVKMFKEPKGRLRYLSLFEIDRLLKELKGMDRSIVITALNTGMRKGEILNLKWGDIDLVNGFINIENTKSGEARGIPINDQLKQELLNIQRYGNFVFSKKDGRPYGNPRKGFESALKRTGIENFRFHDLRHTFASHLAMNGEQLLTIASLLGHKSINMTMRYSHLSQGHLKEAVNFLGEKFNENVKNRSKAVVDNNENFCKILKQ